MNKAPANTKTSRFNFAPDMDCNSSNSNECTSYQDSSTKVLFNRMQYTNLDAESQNFLSDHHLGKKKYEAEYTQGMASFGLSRFNMCNAIMESRKLGLSYAMANTGIAMFAAWYTNRDYLVLMGIVSIILPLSLMKNLGKMLLERSDWKTGEMENKLEETQANKGRETEKRRRRNSMSCPYTNFSPDPDKPESHSDSAKTVQDEIIKIINVQS